MLCFLYFYNDCYHGGMTLYDFPQDFLDSENTNVAETATPNMCLKVCSLVHLSKAFPSFGSCSPLSCFFRSRCCVMEAG